MEPEGKAVKEGKMEAKPSSSEPSEVSFQFSVVSSGGRSSSGSFSSEFSRSRGESLGLSLDGDSSFPSAQGRTINRKISKAKDRIARKLTTEMRPPSLDDVLEEGEPSAGSMDSIMKVAASTKVVEALDEAVAGVVDDSSPSSSPIGVLVKANSNLDKGSKMLGKRKMGEGRRKNLLVRSNSTISQSYVLRVDDKGRTMKIGLDGKPVYDDFDIRKYLVLVRNYVKNAVFSSWVLVEILLALLLNIVLLIAFASRYNMISFPLFLTFICSFPWVVFHYSDITVQVKRNVLNFISIYTGLVCLIHAIVQIVVVSVPSFASEIDGNCSQSLFTKGVTFQIMCTLGFEVFSASRGVGFFIYDVVIFVFAVSLRLALKSSKEENRDESPAGEAGQFFQMLRHKAEIGMLPVLVTLASVTDSSLVTFPLLLITYLQIILWALRKLSFGKMR
jgi:hypothetical protein